MPFLTKVHNALCIDVPPSQSAQARVTGADGREIRRAGECVGPLRAFGPSDRNGRRRGIERSYVTAACIPPPRDQGGSGYGVSRFPSSAPPP